MAVSIREVAAEAQVSLGTVSKVLNNSATAHISAATRTRVYDAARRVGYHPSVLARGLVGKPVNCIGLVMAYHQASVTSDPYLGPCLDGILDTNKQTRQKTVIFTEDSWEDALFHLPSYCDGHCDGLMIIIPRTNSQIISALASRAIPFVLVGDSRDRDENLPLITADVDNTEGARKAVEYLIGLGHRRIAAFCGNVDFHSNTQRLAGYRRALADGGLLVDETLVFPGEYWFDWGRRNMETVLRMPPALRPTAAFCFNDGLALGALELLREKNIGPGEMSVVGFDDTPDALAANLTTVHHPIRAVGARATALLLSLIHGGEKNAALVASERLDATLIVRGSASAPLC